MLFLGDFSRLALPNGEESLDWLVLVSEGNEKRANASMLLNEHSCGISSLGDIRNMASKQHAVNL